MSPDELPPGVRAIVFDADGKPVRLTEERWAHIESDHAELAALEADLHRAIQEPTYIQAGRRPRERWLYLGLAGGAPAPWLKVVISYGEEDGWVVTAFLRRLMP